ncbi:hypothetical protein [Rubrivirga marina]|uniref:AAA+ ATPase domain-containing protein n=1 Tax=Rubrivirga marina TaxID=1196024 RepID=A0A271ISG3_9BACT|nr:hypothetical protein [Rubrivirga marina]PAP74176.1 hypothetical protein BSZ37_21165 [Rubrivirga marina]
MARRDATPKQTGGGGYDFETEVVAYVLAHLIAGRTLIERVPGVPQRVDVQEPASVWHLDDVVLTYPGSVYVAASVKSSAQFGVASFPADFVRDAWEQLLGTSSDAFVEDRDWLALVSAPAPHVESDVQDLLARAHAQSPDELDEDVARPHRANDTVRGLLASAACPDDLVPAGSSPPLAGRMLRRVLWLPFDLNAQNSLRRLRAKELLQDTLQSGDADEADALWESLKEIAWSLRTASGDVDRAGVLARVPPRFVLRGRPDHRPAWEALRDASAEAARRVRHRIGGQVVLPRSRARTDLAGMDAPAVILLGASGVGKSVIARHEALNALEDDAGRVVWASGDALERGNVVSGSPSFPTLMEHDVAPGLLVIDQLDRLYAPEAFARVGALLAAVGLTHGEEVRPGWRTLLTCTPEAWPRVRDELRRDGLAAERVESYAVESPDVDELAPVWEAFPELRPLRLRQHLAPVLLRPKVLDLLALHSTSGLDLHTVGESHLAMWFWDQQIERADVSLDRGAAAATLARKQADRLVTEVRVESGEFDTGERSALEALVDDRLLTRRDDRVRFEHDLYGDWVRLRILREQTESGRLVEFLKSRMDSPVWYRAVRLYGLHLLEHDGLASWREAFAAFEDLGDAADLARDLLLEASAHTVGSARALTALWPVLIEDEGALLNRLLHRLLHSATVPNDAFRTVLAEVAPDMEPYLAASARIPYAPYWVAPLAVLHTHRNEIPYPARLVVARVVALWLQHTRDGWPMRVEAAETAVALGEATLRDKEGRGSYGLRSDDLVSRSVYTAVLLSASQDTDPALAILREASGLSPKRFEPPPLTEEEKEENRAFARQKGVPLGSVFGPPGPTPEPWPDGPAFEVDGSLQHVVLEEGALAPLVVAAPEAAVEILLALLIRAPAARDRYDEVPLRDVYVARPQWHPPFYTRGPFRQLLTLDEDAGIEVIVRLLRHATERWAENHSDRFERWHGKRAEPFVLRLATSDGEIETVGHAEVFGWNLDGPTSEGVVASALMALEKHLYDRIEAGDDVGPLVARLLRETTSTAMVGVLASVGRRAPHLFLGPLRPLLLSPHLFSWTNMGSQNMMWKSAISPPFTLLPRAQHDAYREWHEYPHRRASLVNVALFLLHSDESFREAVADARERWSREVDTVYHGWEYIPTLLAQFDPDNWAPAEEDAIEATDDEDGGPARQILVFQPPPEQQVRNDEAQAEFVANMLPLTTPMDCSQLLDREKEATPECLDELWSRVERLEALSDRQWADTPQSALDVLAGIAAVLAVFGERSTASHAERAAWARATLLEAARSVSDHPGLGMWSARSFAARVLPTVWASDPDDQELRRAVARLALTGVGEEIDALVDGVKAQRARLGNDHLRLVHLILRLARTDRRLGQLRNVARFPPEGGEAIIQDEIDRLDAEREDASRRFVDGSLSATVPPVSELTAGDSDTEPRLRSARPGHRARPDMPFDSGLAVSAFRGIPLPGELAEVESWERWRAVWADAVRETAEWLTLPDDAPTEDFEGVDDPWVRFVASHAAALAAEADSDAEAREYWEPILNLGPSASGLVSWFLMEWWPRAVLGASQVVLRRWQLMIEYAQGHARWALADAGVWFRRDELWRDLLGLKHLSAETWTADRAQVVAAVEPGLRAWAETHLRRDTDVAHLAAFLVLPAADAVRFDGLIWLSDAARREGAHLWKDHTVGPRARSKSVDLTIQLLVHVWQHDREALRQREAAFAAFRHLLGAMVTQQVPVAFELAQRVGDG